MFIIRTCDVILSYYYYYHYDYYNIVSNCRYDYRYVLWYDIIFTMWYVIDPFNWT